MLKKARLTKEDETYYGNGIVLDGISLSPLDLTHLFTIFANNGKLIPLEIAGKVIDKNETILSKQSTYIVSNILTYAPRLYLNNVWKNTKNNPSVIFKTGTIAENKDIYSISVSPNYTLKIWIGNFNANKPIVGKAGITASNIAINMFSYLDKISSK